WSRASIGRLLGVLLPIGISVLLLNLPRTTRLHTDWKPDNNFDRAGKLREMKFIRSLPEQLGEQQHVIFNADFTKNGHIPVMFFTNHIAYPGLPSQETLQQLKAGGLPAAVVARNPLPESLRHDDNVRILEVP
ncbi:MAG: hypothetical protein AAGB22_05050, partial [Bacteroidota bacterium]